MLRFTQHPACRPQMLRVGRHKAQPLQHDKTSLGRYISSSALQVLLRFVDETVTRDKIWRYKF